MRSILAALCLLPPLAGCAAERILRVTSEPPGAEVRWNGAVIGTTPLDHEFLHYGVVRVSLQYAGYHTSSEQVALDAPWYARFPIDIVSEVLLPIGWRDRRHYHIVLEPGRDVMTSPTRRSVLDRASALRHAGPDGPRNLPERVPTELPPLEEDQEQPDPGARLP